MPSDELRVNPYNYANMVISFDLAVSHLYDLSTQHV
ncbi:hypothetical protein PSAB6_230180 [Paraburkholderia sabiae]|nr:hypothetical protein PSAB6_230180 [Paraburkholderia sabiae]